MNSDRDKILQFVRHLHVSETDVNECISNLSETYSVTEEKITEIIFQTIEGIIQNVFDSALSNGMELKPYQKLAVRFMVYNRGMICSFETGTGKTLTAVTAAKCMLDISDYLGKTLKVLVVTPTSLIGNFQKEMDSIRFQDARVSILSKEKFTNRYKKGEIDCSSTFLIVDEAHHFKKDFRGIFAKNVGNIGTLYKEDTRSDLAMKCAFHTWKVMLLTATPFYNKSHDIVNLVSMVKGIYPPLDAVDEPYRLISTGNQSRFKEIYGNTFLFQKMNKEDFPKVKKILVKVVMPPDYLYDYEKKEEEVALKFKDLLQKNKKMISHSDQFDMALRQASNLLAGCIKCGYAMEVMSRRQKTVFYSNFLESGVDVIRNKLIEAGISFREIRGDTDKKDRAGIVQEFNTDDSILVLLITKAGGEGLDLKKVRHIILFEKGWSFSVEEQVIGRGVRYKSHEGLDTSDQDVTIHYMMAIKPYNIYPEKFIEKEYPSLYKFMPKYDEVILIGEEFAAPLPEGKKIPHMKFMFGVDFNLFFSSILKYKQIYITSTFLKQNQITENTIFENSADSITKDYYHLQPKIKLSNLSRYIINIKTKYPERVFVNGLLALGKIAEACKYIYFYEYISDGRNLSDASKKKYLDAKQQFREEYSVVGDVASYYKKIDRHLHYIHQFMTEVPRGESTPHGFYYISLFDNSPTNPKNICGVVCFYDSKTKILWADVIVLYLESYKPQNKDKQQTTYTLCASEIVKLGTNIKATKVIVMCTKEYENFISFKFGSISSERLSDVWRNVSLPDQFSLREKLI